MTHPGGFFGILLLAGAVWGPRVALAQGASQPAGTQQPDQAEGAADAAEPQPPPVDPNTQRARALFAEGVALSDAARFAVAAQRFREALELKDAPAIRYNLASTLIELGEFHEADAMLYEVLHAEDVSESLKRAATQARGDVRARAAELRFTEPGFTRLDGRFLPNDFIDKPLFVVPGEHVMEYVRGGRVLEQRVVTLEAASITTVRWSESTWQAERRPLQLAANPSDTNDARASHAALRFSPLPPSSEAASGPSWAAGVAIAVTVVGVVAAGLVAVLSSDGTGNAPLGELDPTAGGPVGTELLSF